MSALQIMNQPAIEATKPAELVWNDETKAMIRKTLFPNVPDEAVNMALTWCEMYSLNPFSRHVVILKFGSKDKGETFVPYITRDGVVAHAQDTGLLDSIQTRWGTDLKTGELWCEAVVYKKESSRPYTFTAFLSEWQPKEDPKNLWKTQNSLWYTKPRHMLAKVAIMHCTKMAIPMSIPVLDEDSSYFHTVMSAASAVVAVGEIEAVPEQPAALESGVITESVDPAKLSDLFSDDHMPTIEGESVPETPAPSVDSDTLEKARVDVAIMGEDVFTPDVWKIKKSSLIRGVKSDATTLEDLSLEELARLTATITAVKMGNGGNRRL